VIFIDSNVLIAYEVPEDSNHNKSVDLVKRIAEGKYGKAFTSDYVFDETVTVTFVKAKSLEKAIAVGNLIKLSTNILKVNEDIFERAWSFFMRQKGTKLSFTDSTIALVMQEYGIAEIATFDGEFGKISNINTVK